MTQHNIENHGPFIWSLNRIIGALVEAVVNGICILCVSIKIIMDEPLMAFPLLVVLGMGVVLWIALYESIGALILYTAPVYKLLNGRELFVITKCRAFPDAASKLKFDVAHAYYQAEEERMKTTREYIESYIRNSNTVHDPWAWASHTPTPENKDPSGPAPPREDLQINYSKSLVGNAGMLFNASSIKNVRKRYHFYTTAHVRKHCAEILDQVKREGSLPIYELPRLWNWLYRPTPIVLRLVKKYERGDYYGGECTGELAGSDGHTYQAGEFTVGRLHRSDDRVFRFEHTAEEELEDCPALVKELNKVVNEA
jgi:hypothetical protein